VNVFTVVHCWSHEMNEQPVNKEELGRATWTFLHTLAANYPSTPCKQEQIDMWIFLRKFAKLYPCEPCAVDFQDYMTAHPPDISGEGSLSRWMCEAHNDVNRRLGKVEFNCAEVSARWGTCESCEMNIDSLEAFKRMAGLPSRAR